MNEMITFLNARLNEKERRALGTPLDRAEADARLVLPWLNELAPPVPRDETALREVAAMRTIISVIAPILGDGINFTIGEQNRAEDIATAMAAIDSDHPDYRAEWAPR